MSTLTLMTNLSFDTLECYSCAVVWAMPVQFTRNRRDDHKTFYCPNGHGQSFNGPTEADQLRKKLEQAEAATERERRWRRQEAERSESLVRSNRAVRGVATKRAKELARVKAGVCPCCNRTFEALARHMNRMHPDYRPVAEVEAVTSVEIPPQIPAPV